MDAATHLRRAKAKARRQAGEGLLGCAVLDFSIDLVRHDGTAPIGRDLELISHGIDYAIEQDRAGFLQWLEAIRL